MAMSLSSGELGGVPRVAPWDLFLIAILFILGGITAVISMIIALAQGRLSINFGAIGIFVGIGLLRFSPGWRTCALVLTWFGIVVSPLLALIGVLSGKPATLRLPFQAPIPVSPYWGIIIGIVVFLLMVWQYRVLTRPRVRMLFGLR